MATYRDQEKEGIFCTYFDHKTKCDESTKWEEKIIEESLSFNSCDNINHNQIKAVNKYSFQLWNEMADKIEAIEEEYIKKFDEYLSTKGLESIMGVIGKKE